MSNRKGDWIQTYTGRQFWPLDPRQEDVCIEDIAHALSLKCRYQGHCREFYSVAQHSVIVSELVPPEDALWGLMHDAAEAYLPDVPRPVKGDLIGFRQLEDRVLEAVAEAFGLTLPMPASVKHADLVALHTERRDLMATPPIPWATDGLADPMPKRIHAWGPERAEMIFHAKWRQLALERQGAE